MFGRWEGDGTGGGGRGLSVTHPPTRLMSGAQKRANEDVQQGDRPSKAARIDADQLYDVVSNELSYLVYKAIMPVKLSDDDTVHTVLDKCYEALKLKIKYNYWHLVAKVPEKREPDVPSASTPQDVLLKELAEMFRDLLLQRVDASWYIDRELKCCKNENDVVQLFKDIIYDAVEGFDEDSAVYEVFDDVIKEYFSRVSL